MTASRPGRAEQVSTRIIFFVLGLAGAAWAPLVPYVKARLAADESTLGFILLCVGLGSIVAMPFSATLAARFGCRAVVAVCTLVLCAVLPVLAIASTIPSLAVALFIFGAVLGTTDATINMQAVIVERASGRAMMSGFHGLFSVGGIAGAASVSLMLWAGATPFTAIVVVSAAILASLLLAQAHLLPYGTESEGPHFAIPHGLVLLIGVLCFIAFLAEGAVLDWGAVFLVTRRAFAPAYAGIGYALFAAAMTLGRLTGDRIVQALGSRTILVAGSIVAAAGFALAVLAPSQVLALCGFALVGLGASNIVPVLYAALGRQRAMPLNVAVAAVTLLGYLGILAGPALIGFAAGATNLSISLLGVGMLVLVVAASAAAVPRETSGSPSQP